MNKKDYTMVMNKGIRSAVAFIKRCGGIPLKGHYSQGYHYNSGFFTTKNGNLAYWMTGDDRGIRNEGEPKSFMDCPLFRTAAHLKDYTGGTNNYPRTVDEVRRWMDSVDRMAEAGWEGDSPDATKREIGFVQPPASV